MKVSVVIPVFNEVNYISQILTIVKKSFPLDKEIIVVDDFSTDGTREFLLQNPHLYSKLVCHDRNMGKGRALRTGFENVTGDVIIIQDADLEYDPIEYPLLLQPILSGKADIVFGSRFLTTNPRRVLYFWHYVANKVLTLLTNIVTDLNLSDMETCYKVFRKEVLNGMELCEDRFGFEPEFTCKIARRNWRIYEVGISYSGRTYEEGKKIGFKDAVRALYCIFKYGVLRL
ncbi:MAG: glycosyltransferase family 2 protein [Deltaproteobacteria bacterium]|nr:glycosyltransferase family 2 protein [Deltaproteobacteria bacterium]MCX7952941.1 glycosyltransferase family 2 protein [Deltaproteobacteria bacterium]